MEENSGIIRYKKMILEVHYFGTDVYFADAEGNKIWRLPSLPVLNDGDTVHLNFDQVLEYPINN